MYFLYPDFLWALVLLIIPVIIHFFNIRRYKKVYFSDIRLLKQLTQESQVRNKLKEYIILAERLLALFFLIMAFAQPVWKKDKNNLLSEKNDAVVIYIDNSFSMENTSKEGKLFETAINKSKEIINSFSKSTKFYIYTNDADIHYTKSLSQNEAFDILSKIKTSPSSVPISVIFNRIQTLHLSKPVVFVFSDAQKQFMDFQNLKNINFTTFFMRLEPSQKNNLSIDSVWTDNPVALPNNLVKLHLKISNHNFENINDVPVKLILNNIQKSIINVSVPAHQSAETEISLMLSDDLFQLGKLVLNDYPVTFDDELYFSINSNIKIKVLLINGAENPYSQKYFKSLFQNDSIFIFSEQQERQINFSELNNQDVVILNELTEFSSGLNEQLKILADKGKTIIVIPYIKDAHITLPDELQSFQWKIDTARHPLSNDILKHPLFSNSFEKTQNNYKMPIVKEYIYSDNNSNFEPLIQFDNSKIFLLKYIKNNGNYFLFTSSFNPEKNQLPTHALFVPIMYQLSFTSVPVMPLYYYIKSNPQIKLSNFNFNSDNPPKIISADKNNTTQWIPSLKIQNNSAFVNIPSYFDITPGHYYLNVKDKNLLTLSFNYNRAESDMQFYTESEIKDILIQYKINNFYVNDVSHAPFKQIIQSEITGQSFWKLCVILCLIFLIAESLTIRFFK